MRLPSQPIHVLTLLVFVVAIAVITTPVAANTGAEASLQSAFANMGPPDGIGAECAWWIPWCW